MSQDPNISNIMNLMNLFSSANTSPTKNLPQDRSWPMFPLDAQIHTEPLRVCKSLVPYLPYEKQKNICIFIKMYELMSVVDHFSRTDLSRDAEPNLRESETWHTDLLYSVKDSLDPKNAYWVDILLKFNDVKTILESAQKNPPPASPDPPKISKEFTENISPMLDDKQKQVLELLSTIIK